MLCEKYKNFEDWVIYQIYPRSFCDSNNDGVGDIGGIISKLDYLCDLGVNAIWLSPCYKSPMVDNGYDISDYRDINPMFGNLDDMKRLISEMHKRNMKLIMDLVANHTSSEHFWFKESRKSKNNPYSDYYYWFDEPQNDLKAAFGGSVWEYAPERNQYYLHSFAVEQPDLNWDNPDVVKEMQDVVDFWVDMGVDGFRCDVIDRISKDIKNGIMAYGPRLREYIGDLFGRSKTEKLFTVGECWCSDVKKMVEHSAAESNELSTLFQFDHLNIGREDKFTPKKDTLNTMKKVISRWEKLCIENDILYTLFTDNHDQNYLISRAGNDTEYRYESASCIATMEYLLRGVPFIYEGQEFGSVGSDFPDISWFDDTETMNEYKELTEKMSPDEAIKKINFGSRDNTRHPMAWNGSENGGFSKIAPWLKSPSRYKEINLESDLKSEKSVFRFYKKLLEIREKHDSIRHGEYEEISSPDDKYFAYIRSNKNEKILVVVNFEEENDISLGFDGQIILSNYNRLSAPSGHYKKYESAVYKIM